MTLKYDIHDTLTAAIMNSKPFLVVEGKDDYQIYTAFTNAYNRNIDVFQVAEFQDFSAGCEHVVHLIEKIQPQLQNDTRTKTKVLGIIDRDSRTYRDTIPSYIGLFITKYYAIETYFATKNNLKKLIAHISYIPHTDIPDAVIDSVVQKFEETSNDLYYISLEALKNACDTDYSAAIGYDEKKYGKTNRTLTEDGSRTHLMTQIFSQKNDLDAFAQSKNVAQSDLKLIAKAKWYLFAFVYHAYQYIKNLKDVCKYNHIQQCRSCRVGNTQDCLYKMKLKNYREEDLYNTIQAYIDEIECHDIIDAIRILN